MFQKPTSAIESLESSWMEAVKLTGWSPMYFYRVLRIKLNCTKATKWPKLISLKVSPTQSRTCMLVIKYKRKKKLIFSFNVPLVSIASRFKLTNSFKMVLNYCIEMNYVRVFLWVYIFFCSKNTWFLSASVAAENPKRSN